MVLCILIFICEFLYTCIFFSYQSDESVSKCLRVMKKSQQLLHYNNTKTNKEMKYFNFVGAEGDNAVIVKCYITSKFNTIEPGLSFRFQNLTARGKSEYWATSKTMISYTSTVDVNPDIVLPYLPENLPPDGLSQSLQEALNSSEKSSIMGKIVKVYICNLQFLRILVTSRNFGTVCNFHLFHDFHYFQFLHTGFTYKVC